MHTTGFVPKVLVAGNVEQFRARLRANQAAEVIGSVSFIGKHNDQSFDLIKDQKILLNDRIVEVGELKNMAARSEFDYIVFLEHLHYWQYIYRLTAIGIPGSQILMYDFFEHNVGDQFCDYINEQLLFRLLKAKQTCSLFDADSYFVSDQYYIKPKSLDRLIIDGVRSEAKNYAIFGDFYAHIYDSPLDCRFRHYDAILLTAERNFDDLREAISSMKDMTDEFIVFVRKTSALQKNFAVQNVKGINGGWVMMKPSRNDDLAIYVVSHKKHSLTTLPDGYITIHAGRALGEDLGYIGDDTGDNISAFNPYLNELTALYWVWKNARQSIVGIAHYRRFFSGKDSTKFNVADIVTSAQARELLKKYDAIIGGQALFNLNSQNGWMVYDSEYDVKLAMSAINVIKKMLGRHQPEYVDAFEQIMNGRCLFPCNMMITRKYVFDAYCQWLFSFILPALDEFKDKLANVSVRRKRMLGFVAERMFGVWLLKNRLRLRELPIMVAP